MKRLLLCIIFLSLSLDMIYSQNSIVRNIPKESSSYLQEGDYKSVRSLLRIKVKNETREDKGKYSGRLAFLLTNGLGGKIDYVEALRLLEEAWDRAGKSREVELSVLILLRAYYSGTYHINRNLKLKEEIKGLIDYRAEKSSNLIDVFLNIYDYFRIDPYRCEPSYNNREIFETLTFLWENYKFPPALDLIAELYKYGGFGVQKNEAKAIESYKILEAISYYPAYDKYSELIELKNPSKGHELVLKAAENDEFRSMYPLMYNYLKGSGTIKDKEKFHYWFNKSLAFGNKWGHLVKATYYYYNEEKEVQSQDIRVILNEAAEGDIGAAYYLLAKLKIKEGHRKEAVVNLYEKGMRLGHAQSVWEYGKIKAYGSRQDRQQVIRDIEEYRENWGQTPWQIGIGIEVVLRMMFNNEVSASIRDYEYALKTYDMAFNCIKCPESIQKYRNELAEWIARQKR